MTELPAEAHWADLGLPEGKVKMARLRLTLIRSALGRGDAASVRHHTREGMCILRGCEETEEYAEMRRLYDEAHAA